MKKPSRTYMFGRNEIFIVFLLLVFTSLLLFSVGVMIGKRLLENECKLILEDGQKKLETCQKDIELKTKAASLPSIPTGIAAAATTPSTANIAAAKPETVAKPEIVAKPETKAKPETAGKPETPAKPAQAVTPPKVEAAKQEADPSHLGIKEITTDIKGKYTVQVSAYKDELEAQQMAYSLYNMGFKSAYYIETELPNKGLWYRVGIGFFDKKTSADLFGEMLRKQNKISSYIVRKVE
jgi:cell division septation protein DedD